MGCDSGIQTEGWKPKTFASAQEFLARFDSGRLLCIAKYLTTLGGRPYPPPMNEFQLSVANALRYWETRRVVYNAVLTAVAAVWVLVTWPHFRSVRLMGIPSGETHPALLILVILAFLANVCYSAAYLVDIPLQLTFASWRKHRWALLLVGTLFAMLVENYWIADEIYPFASR